MESFLYTQIKTIEEAKSAATEEVQGNLSFFLSLLETILAFPRKAKQKEDTRFVASEESDPTQIGENPPEKIVSWKEERSKAQREKNPSWKKGIILMTEEPKMDTIPFGLSLQCGEGSKSGREAYMESRKSD